jgi:hypothetical protein
MRGIRGGVSEERDWPGDPSTSEPSQALPEAPTTSAPMGRRPGPPEDWVARVRGVARPWLEWPPVDRSTDDPIEADAWPRDRTRPITTTAETGVREASRILRPPAQIDHPAPEIPPGPERRVQEPFPIPGSPSAGRRPDPPLPVRTDPLPPVWAQILGPPPVTDPPEPESANRDLSTPSPGAETAPGELSVPAVSSTTPLSPLRSGMAPESHVGEHWIPGQPRRRADPQIRDSRMHLPMHAASLRVPPRTRSLPTAQVPAVMGPARRNAPVVPAPHRAQHPGPSPSPDTILTHSPSAGQLSMSSLDALETQIRRSSGEAPDDPVGLKRSGVRRVPSRRTSDPITRNAHPWPGLESVGSQSVSSGDRWPSLPSELEASEPEPAPLSRERDRWARLEREQGNLG